MSPLDRKVADLRDLVAETVRQHQVVDEAVANGPHIDLTCPELRLAEYLGDGGPRIMRELAEFMGLAVNSITSLIDNLEKKQIVRRQRSEEDRRVVRVELTDAGKVAYEAAVKEKMRFLRGILGALTDEEQDIFIVLFRKIARAGRSQMQEMAAAS